MDTHNSSGRRPHREGALHVTKAFWKQGAISHSLLVMVFALDITDDLNKCGASRRPYQHGPSGRECFCTTLKQDFKIRHTKEKKTNTCQDCTKIPICGIFAVLHVGRSEMSLLTLPSLRWPPLCVITTTSIHFRRCCWERKRNKMPVFK